MEKHQKEFAELQTFASEETAKADVQMEENKGLLTAVLAGHAKALGVDAAESARNREGRSSDDRVEAALRFAVAVVATRGWVTDDDLRWVRVAGYGDGAIVDIVATVAFNIFTNYFDHVAEPELDFPLVETGDSVAA